MHFTLWQDVIEIWPQIRQFPPDQWDHALEKICGDRKELATELRSLLASDDSRTTFLDRPLLSLDPSKSGFTLVPQSDGRSRDDQKMGSENAGWIGRRLGAYEIQRVLGQGGMGVVFLARRVDGEVEQDVAIKVVRRLLLGTEAETKFRRERQILSGLQHPYIARLLDVGSDADGCPYEVMEYVRGVPVTAFCARRALGIEERVRLISKICEAVQAAHKQHIVHRDLKPANILVTEDGIPKLLDFGIAKRFDLAGIQPTTRPMMTLDYASPEQLAGQSVGATSDVYSLGVLLYELITGVLPYGDEAFDVLGRQQRILAGPPRLPSERALHSNAPSPGWSKGRGAASFLEGAVLRDLDRVVLKALETDPSRRYVDAASLAEDLQRILERKPVMARPSGWMHRFGKLVLRHRVAAACIAALSLASGSLAAVSWQQAQTHVLQEAEHDRLRQQTDEMIRFLEDSFREADPYLGSESLKTMRASLAEYTDRVLQTLSDHPGLQGRLIGTLGVLHQKLGLYAEAESLLRRSLVQRRHAFGGEHSEVALAKRDLGWLLAKQGDLEAGSRFLEQALAIGRRAPRGHATHLSITLNHLANVRNLSGDYGAAEALHREALGIRQQLGDADLIAECEHDLARLLADLRRLDEAEALATEALESVRTSHGEDAAIVAHLRFVLARVAALRWQHNRAVEVMQEALETLRPKLGERHPTVAVMLNNLANSLEGLDRMEEAEAVYREALRVHRAALGDDHFEVAVTQSNLAALLSQRGDLTGAQDHYEEAVHRFRRSLGEYHPTTAHATLLWARHLRQLGRPTEAEPLARASLEAMEQRLSPDHPRLIFARALLATTWRDLGDTERAEALLLDALARGQESPESSRWHLASAWFPLAELRRDQGQFAEAEAIYRRMLADLPETQAQARHLTALCLVDVLVLSGDTEEALALLEAHLVALRASVAREHPHQWMASNIEGAVRIARGEHGAGLELLRSSQVLLEAALGKNAPLSRRAQQRWAWAHRSELSSPGRDSHEV